MLEHREFNHWIERYLSVVLHFRIELLLNEEVLNTELDSAAEIQT